MFKVQLTYIRSSQGLLVAKFERGFTQMSAVTGGGGNIDDWHGRTSNG